MLTNRHEEFLNDLRAGRISSQQPSSDDGGHREFLDDLRTGRIRPRPQADERGSTLGTTIKGSVQQAAGIAAGAVEALARQPEVQAKNAQYRGSQYRDSMENAERILDEKKDAGDRAGDGEAIDRTPSQVTLMRKHEYEAVRDSKEPINVIEKFARTARQYWQAKGQKTLAKRPAHVTEPYAGSEVYAGPDKNRTAGQWAEKLANDVVGLGIQTLPTLLTAYAAGPAAGALVGATQEASGAYGEAVDDGMNPTEAFGRAAAFGAVSAVLNKIGLDAIMKKLPPGVLPKIVKIMGASLTESVTEALEEPAQNAAMATDLFWESAKTLVESGELDENARRVLQSMVEVAAPSAIMGGIGAAGARATSQLRQEPSSPDEPIDLSVEKKAQRDVVKPGGPGHRSTAEASRAQEADDASIDLLGDSHMRGRAASGTEAPSQQTQQDDAPKDLLNEEAPVVEEEPVQTEAEPSGPRQEFKEAAIELDPVLQEEAHKLGAPPVMPGAWDRHEAGQDESAGDPTVDEATIPEQIVEAPVNDGSMTAGESGEVEVKSARYEVRDLPKSNRDKIGSRYGVYDTQKEKFASYSPTREDAERSLEKILGVHETSKALEEKRAKKKEVRRAKDEGSSEVEGWRTGTPITVNGWQGKGRTDKSSAYAEGVEEPALGAGDYIALNEEDARFYGPNVKAKEVSLENPYVVDSDNSLSELVGGAPVPYANEERKAYLKKSRAELERRGHDGVVVMIREDADVNKKGESFKRVREIFTTSQILRFQKTAKEDTKAEITFDDFERDYNELFAEMSKYSLDDDGYKVAAAQMEAMEYEHPDWVADIENAAEAQAAPESNLDDVPEGQRFESVTPQGDVTVRGRWRFMSADDLVSSDQEGYNARLQPRDRDTASSQEQIAQIAVKPDPRRLDESAITDSGAPLVDAQGQVISGNGRVIGLRQAYGANKAGHYKARMVYRANKLGLDTEGVKRGILVREILDTSGESLQRVAELSNRSQTLQRTEAEQAEADAKILPGIMHLFAPSLSGDIRAGSNRPFLTRFVQETGDQSLRTGEGDFASTIEVRVKHAILSRIFQKSEAGRKVVVQVIESPEAYGVKRLLDGIAMSGGKLLKLADEKPSLDLTPYIGKALEDYVAFKKEQNAGRVKSLDEYLGQGDLFASGRDVRAEILMREFDSRASAKAVRALFDSYLEMADNVDTQTASLFGADEVPDTNVGELLERARHAGREEDTATGQAELFGSAEEQGKRREASPRNKAAGQGRARNERRKITTPPASKPEIVPPKKPVESKRAEDAAKASPISDFGEKLGGARKDYYSRLMDAQGELDENDLDKAAKGKLSLDKLFPAPDYDALMKAGMSGEDAVLIYSLRSTIGRPPRGKRKAWLQMVLSLRRHVVRFIETNEVGQLRKHLANNQRLHDKITKRSKYYLAMGFPDVPKGADAYEIAGLISAKGGRFYAVKGNQIIGDDYETYDAAAEALRAKLLADTSSFKSKVKLEVYKYRAERTWTIGKRQRAGKQLDLKGGFNTPQEADDYLGNNREELEALYEKKRTVPSERRETNEPREGEDYLKGKDATPEMFQDAFGFRGVEFGNWVEGSKRQESLNQAYVALMDLAKALKVPTKALSLNGSLGLGFGSRGRGGKRAPSAHFEPDTIVINLTKKAGAGSLAHEWWHAVDNYFSRMQERQHEYLSEDPRHSVVSHPIPGSLLADERPHPGLRAEIVQSFKAIMDTLEKTGLRQRGKQLDKRRTNDYWSQGREMSARVFEQYVIAALQKAGIRNDYLANIETVEGYTEPEVFPYLLESEKKDVHAAFDSFFDVLESKETDKGVALYSTAGPVSEDVAPGAGMTVAGVEKATGPLQKRWKNGPKGIEVVQSFGDLPVSVREGAPDGVRGAYDEATDTVYLVADRLAGADEAVFVALHEVVGHRGVGAILKAREITNFYTRLAVGRHRDIAKYAKGRDMAFGKATEKQAVAKEWFADRVASDDFQGIKKWWNRFLELIRKGLGRLTRSHVGESELESIAKAAVGYTEGRSPKAAPMDTSSGKTVELAPAGAVAYSTAGIVEHQNLFNKAIDYFDNELRTRSGYFDDFRSLSGKEDVNARAELGVLTSFLNTINHYAKKVPALDLVYRAAHKLRDDKHILENLVFNMGTKGEGESELAMLRDFVYQGLNWRERNFTGKTNAEWKKLEQYVLDYDREAVAMRVKEDGGEFVLFDEEGKEVKRYKTEDAAYEAAYLTEGRNLITAGYSKEAARALLAMRHIGHRGHAQLRDSFLERLKVYELLGVEPPKVRDNNGEMVTIWEALTRMGDRRTYHYPRMRDNYQYVALATKQKGTGKDAVNLAPPYRKHFLTEKGRQAWSAKMKGKGYKITYELNETPGEYTFQGVDVAKLNSLLQSALDHMEKSKTDDYEIGEFGFRAFHYDYILKDGTPEQHLMVVPMGNKRKAARKRFGKILKEEFGGNWYEYNDESKGDSGEGWHFINPPGNLKKSILKRMIHHEYKVLGVTQAFGEEMAKEMANLLHSHGSRSAKIGRGKETGIDVYRGYDEDVLRSVTRSGKAIAAGTAKRVMALSMNRAIMGTDVTWEEYKREHPPKKGLTKTELGVYYRELWDEYDAMVEKKRLHSGIQKRAFKEAIQFSNEMIRNEETIERVFGHMKGLAALKYLSGIAPAVVNLTALITNMPAVMLHFGKIPMRQAPVLIARGLNAYRKHWMYAKFGKGEGLTGDDKWLFDEITKRGWDDALFNMEAMEVLQNNVQRHYGRMLEFALAPFAITEKFNRASSIAGSFWGLQSQHKGPLTAEAKEAMLQQAKLITDKGHAVYGKETLPSWMRGSGVGAQVAKSWYMYKTFTHNYLQILGEMGVGAFKGDKNAAKSFAWLLLSPGIVGGTGATLFTPVAKLALKALAAVLGFEEPDDPEEEFNKWMGDTFGPVGERTTRSGVAGLMGLNLKGSLSIGITDVPTSISDLLGAPASMVEDFYDGGANIARGDFWLGAEQIAPRVLASPMKAYRELTRGVTTRSNQPVFYGDERLKASFMDALTRSFGFNPAGLSEKREEQWAERMNKQKYDDRRSEIYKKVRRLALKPIKSRTEWLEILQEVEAYNARVRRKKLGYVPQITPATLKSILTKTEKAPAAERRRSKPEPMKKYSRKNLLDAFKS